MMAKEAARFFLILLNIVSKRMSNIIMDENVWLKAICDSLL